MDGPRAPSADRSWRILDGKFDLRVVIFSPQLLYFKLLQTPKTQTQKKKTYENPRKQKDNQKQTETKSEIRLNHEPLKEKKP